MPVFAYKVRDKKGAALSGTIEGDSELSIITRLRQAGYLIINITEKAEPATVGKILGGLGKVKFKDLTIFSRQFATMISAGLPLTKCLDILTQQTPNAKFKAIIAHLLRDVEGGQTLSAALAHHPQAFPELYVSMVRAGETSGVLDDVLLRLAEHFEKELALKGKIKAAMIYPTLMLSFALLVTFFMITFIVPIFAQMFQDLGGTLPLPTRVLMGASQTIRNFWYLVIPVLIAIIFAIRRVLKTGGGRLWLDNVKLRLPLFGVLSRKISISHFTRTLGTLINSGVPILSALEIVEATAGNLIIAGAVDKVRIGIKEGETIAGPLDESGVFPPMVVQMISVGEETGTLGAMLQKIADFYDEEVATSVDGLTALIEPIMIVCIGVLIGGILMSLYLPMFNLVNIMK